MLSPTVYYLLDAASALPFCCLSYVQRKCILPSWLATTSSRPIMTIVTNYFLDCVLAAYYNIAHARHAKPFASHTDICRHLRKVVCWRNAASVARGKDNHASAVIRFALRHGSDMLGLMYIQLLMTTAVRC